MTDRASQKQERTERSESASAQRLQRIGAEGYMRLMLVSFAVSVLGTRLFLALTGYPQLGNDTLHIAHALWGGLLLFIASLLPLLLDNPRTYLWSATLSGVGAGLFIDEVGKFITQDNDYFFPAAAPIIYAVFLFSVLLFIKLRGERSLDARQEMLYALEQSKNALSASLQPEEYEALEARLRRVAASSSEEELRGLARALEQFLHQETVQRSLSSPGFFVRLRQRLEGMLTRRLTEPRLRLWLIITLGILGALAASDLALVVAVAADASTGGKSAAALLVNRFARIDITTTRGFILLLTRVALDGAIGLMFLAAALLLYRQRAHRAMTLAYYGLLLSLTVLNLLVFYFDQFAAAVGALVQFVLLQAVLWYRDHYEAPAPVVEGEPVGP